MPPSRVDAFPHVDLVFSRARRKILYACIAIASGVLGIAAIGFYFGAKMPFGSVDVALHYLVVGHYVEWTHIDDETMRHYPPGAHILAALLSRLSNLSPFMAMYETSLACVFLCYFILFLSLQEASALIALLSSGAATIAIYMLRQSWSIYGFEIVGNFFFAQAAGAAAFLLCLWIASGLKRRTQEVALFPIIGFALGWIYPLSQIDWAAGCFTLWIIEGVRLRRAGALQTKHLLEASLLASLLLVSILIHPEFYYMIRISFNNGGLNPVIGSLLILRMYNIALAFVGLALLVLAILKPRKSTAFIAAAAIATALCSGVQDVALAFGFGSEYAVRKHTFAIITVLIFAVLGLASQANWERASGFVYAGRFPVGFGPVVASLFAVFSVTSIVSVYAYDRSSFLALQDEVRNRAFLRGRTVALDKDLQAEFNYILSLGDFRLPIALAVVQNLGIGTTYTGKPPDFALVSGTSPLPKDCDVPTGPLYRSRLVRYACQESLAVGR